MVINSTIDKNLIFQICLSQGQSPLRLYLGRKIYIYIYIYILKKSFPLFHSSYLWNPWFFWIHFKSSKAVSPVRLITIVNTKTLSNASSLFKYFENVNMIKQWLRKTESGKKSVWNGTAAAFSLLPVNFR